MRTYPVRANGGHLIHLKLPAPVSASLCGHNPSAANNCWMMKRRGYWRVMADPNTKVTCKKCIALATTQR